MRTMPRVSANAVAMHQGVMASSSLIYWVVGGVALAVIVLVLLLGR